MYLTYEEYEELGGTLTKTAFKPLEFESRKKIDVLTFGRLIGLEEQREEVKMCIFKLVGIINDNNALLKSESVDGYSVTYLEQEELQQTQNKIIEEYLSECYLDDGTPYLYRGI